MRRFARLYEALDRTTSTNAKVRALVEYFEAAPPGDAAWALFFLTGRRIKRLLPSRVLWELTLGSTRLPPWLLEHCFAAVGDLAEVVALLVDHGEEAREDLSLEAWIRERVLPLKGMDLGAQAEALSRYWAALGTGEILVLNKIITGEFRVGASATLVIRALATVAGVPPAVMTHRVMGEWSPTPDFFRSLLAAEGGEPLASRPYPFFLASPLPEEPSALGPREEWQAEWKWDGIRAQLVRRAGEVYLWSRGEELVTERFPEVAAVGSRLAGGTVLDGEILAYRESVLPFAVLQTRIGRQKLTARVLEDAPVAFMAYDLLEEDGRDVRPVPLVERRAHLAALVTGLGASRLSLSPVVEASSWEELGRRRQEARARNVEGLMLKRLLSAYGTGRKRGDWWKYTFAVWHDGELVPVAKAYSGLSDAEIQELDAWARRHTLERFGPTRRVEPVQVFELGFEGIARSGRHRSGLALRFPRILRWRKDKPAAEADTLTSLQAGPPLG